MLFVATFAAATRRHFPKTIIHRSLLKPTTTARGTTIEIIRAASSSSLSALSSFSIHSKSSSQKISSTFLPRRRSFARSSGPTDETPFDKAVTFCVTVGHSREISEGVVQALQESGLSGEALLVSVKSLAGRWEVGEDEGLEALAASVSQSLLAKKGNNNWITLHVIPPNAWPSKEGQEDDVVVDREKMLARAFTVRALEGSSLTDVAKFGTGEGSSTLGEYIECACSGIMACSTCHVVIDGTRGSGSNDNNENPSPKQQQQQDQKSWFDKVGPPSTEEQDMLDLAYSPRDTSRLGCQIILTKELDGIIIQLPGGANNLMDYIPFE